MKLYFVMRSFKDEPFRPIDVFSTVSEASDYIANVAKTEYVSTHDTMIRFDRDEDGTATLKVMRHTDNGVRHLACYYINPALFDDNKIIYNQYEE